MDKTELLKLYNRGMSQSEIAIQLGVKRSSVSYHMRRLGLRPNKATEEIDIDALRAAASSGQSFSSFAKSRGHTLAAVSKAAKRNNIVSPTMSYKKELPIAELVNGYKNKSLFQLSHDYSRPIAVIKRALAAAGVKIRTFDEAVRPPILNNKSEFICAIKQETYRGLAKKLGVSTSAIIYAAKRFGINYKGAEIPKLKVCEMYLESLMSPRAIANELGFSYGVILRALHSYGLKISAPGGISRPSKYPQLNDPIWLRETYATKSLNEIASIIGAPVSMVVYYLNKYSIKLRAKSEWMPLLRAKGHGVKSEKHGIKLDSLLETEYLDSLPDDAVWKRDILVECGKASCVIDFEVDGQLVEVKSKHIASGDPWLLDRRRAIKQMKICEANNLDLQFVFGKSGIWDKAITDDDIYAALDWRLFFSTASDCCDWLINYGFKPPRRSNLELYDSIKAVQYCKPGNELNANFPNVDFRNVTTHFFPHFWSSSRKGYNPPSAAWRPGNLTVLREVINNIWDSKNLVNIHLLLKTLPKEMKDFTVVSLFKPWIASHVYDRYLPNGGTIIDPCIGWGGRFMGTWGRRINYIGYDLNLAAVDSVKELAHFAKHRINMPAEFYNADSSTVQFADGDLLFTSPPYDDTELYAGIDSKKTITKPILDNIFNFKGMIALNLPQRLESMCLEVAKKHGRRHLETLKMRTASVMGRKKTYEPILVFERL